MRYIITGATSFIGLEFTKLVLECGHDVYAVCREGSKSLEELPKDQSLTIVFASMEEYAILPSKIKTADVFVNFAWDGTNHSGRDVVETQQLNVDFSIAALKAAHQMGCKVFVESGSQAEYGSVSSVITEETPCHPFSEYGKAKLRMKEEGFKMAEQLGIKYIHLRIFSLYGENDHPWTLVMSTLDKMLKDETVDLSLCTQNWNFLYVKDAALQIERLCKYAIVCDKFVHEVYNIASKDTRILKDFVLVLKELSHSTSKLNFGAIQPDHLVSLQPDVNKTEKAAGYINDYKFEEVVRLIVNKKLAKPDIFDKIDNFKTFAFVKSHLLYGDLDVCKKPLISVVMPVYNRPDLFEKSLMSVLNQDCDIEYEVVVVDNNDNKGESPNLDIVRKHASDKLFYYRHEQNIGGYGNLNRGIELARADYVSFCHDDDLFLPHALRVIWNLHLKNGDKSITSSYHLMNEEGIVLSDLLFPRTHFRGLIRERQSYKVSVFDQFMWPSGLDICNLYNRHHLIELGGYNPAQHPCCDNALLAAYTYYYGSVNNNIPSLIYRCGENASRTLWPLFADAHLHQRMCMAKKIHLPHFILKRIYMANYRMNKVQHRIFWNKESSSIWSEVSMSDRYIIRIINILLRLKHYKLNIPFMQRKDFKLFIPANSKL